MLRTECRLCHRIGNVYIVITFRLYFIRKRNLLETVSDLQTEIPPQVFFYPRRYLPRLSDDVAAGALFRGNLISCHLVEPCCGNPGEVSRVIIQLHGFVPGNADSLLCGGIIHRGSSIDGTVHPCLPYLSLIRSRSQNRTDRYVNPNASSIISIAGAVFGP
jgi:hypothetical protein